MEGDRPGQLPFERKFLALRLARGAATLVSGAAATSTKRVGAGDEREAFAGVLGVERDIGREEIVGVARATESAGTAAVSFAFIITG